MMISAFYMWNLPYKALLQFLPRVQNQQSPYGTVSTPSDIEITSPGANTVSSPALSQAVALRLSRQRAELFVSGKFDDLLQSLDRGEKK
jgi:hypothetical protein